MKKCNTCGQLKPETEFYKHGRAKDGLQRICKECADKKKVHGTGETNPLGCFQPRELIAELRRRGYRGELRFENVIKL